MPKYSQQHQVTLSGNTAGALALISSGTMSLAGGNNITLSQAGNAVTISGGAGGAETQTAISGLANSQTTYTSGTVSLSELGAITIRSTTGQQFQLSVNAQSVQPETQTFVAGIGNSQTTYTSGTVNLSVEGGALTIRSTTGQAFRFSVSQSVQPETQTFIAGIANSQTTYTSGTVSLSELGAITVRSTTGNQYQLSVNAQSTQTQGILSAGISTGGNTAGNTTVNTGSRFVLVASGNATASQATAAGASTVTISVGTQTVQTQDVLSIGVSTGGNTSGDTTVNTGSRLVLAGGNNITLSQGTGAGATTITISAPNLGGGAFSAGVSNIGNTAGSTGVTGTRLVLVGTNNLSLLQSTDANGGTVSFDNTVSNYTMGVSDLGNTAGSTGATRTRMILVGTNDITLSQSTDAAGGTITIVPGNPISFWDNMGAGGATATFELSNAALNIYPLNPLNAVFPGMMTVSSVFFDLSGTVSTGAPFTRSLSFGIYSQGTVAGEIYLLCSASTSWGTNAANMNMNDSMAGRRWVTIQSSQFNTQPRLSKERYWMAIWHRSSSGSQTFAFSGQTGMYATGIRSGFMSAASATNTTLGAYPFLGNYSVSFTTAMPATLVGSDINKSNATAASLPRIIFNNIQTNIH